MDGRKGEHKVFVMRFSFAYIQNSLRRDLCNSDLPKTVLHAETRQGFIPNCGARTEIQCNLLLKSLLEVICSLIS